MDAIDCFALYGTVNWEMGDVQKYVSAMSLVFKYLNIPATHYGYCEEPLQKYGPHIGSIRNVQKKICSLYSNGLRLKTLEFFSLPKGYGFQYSDYRAYFARGVDYLVLAYDIDTCNPFSSDALIAEMRKHISAIWGEHFLIRKGEQPLTYCMGQFESNSRGENLEHDFYIQSVHVIEQFKL